jgi:peroxiredoxin
MRRLPTIVLAIALGLACLLVVVLALQNRQLQRRYGELLARTRPPNPGLYAPAARLPTLQGDSVTIGEPPPGGQQLLFVFTTTCPYCRASLAAWEAIAGVARSSAGTEVYGVSLDSLPPTRKYVETHKLSFPVLALPPGRLPVLYRAYTVPLTMIIDADGRVAYSRLGLLAGQVAVDSVVAAMAVGAS